MACLFRGLEAGSKVVRGPGKAIKRLLSGPGLGRKVPLWGEEGSSGWTIRNP